MSGLVVICNVDGAPIEKSLLDKFTKALSSKGNDTSITWIHDHIGFGHALHKTTNEAEYERYPCTLDEKVWLVSSARIDDRESLVKRLGLQSRIDLQTTPDSELILHAYKTWDMQCLNYISGDFTFVIWDDRKKELICARDRFGVRQLYYVRIKNTFLFSNSIYSLFHHPQISTKLNDQVIADFLLFGESVWLDKEKNLTVFDEIYKIPPAHTLTIKNGKYSVERYWNFPTDTPLLRYDDSRDYTSHFIEIFKKAVKDRLRNPSIAISMSGGIDSTTIASIISDIKNEDKTINEITAITSTYENLYQDDERYYADLVSKKLNIPIEYIFSKDYLFLDTPIITTRPMEFYQPALWMDTFKKAASKSRVLLNGYAGDNLLAFTPLFNINFRELTQYNTISNIIFLYKNYGHWPAIGSGIYAAFRSTRQSQKIFNGIFSNYPKWLNRQFEIDLCAKERWQTFHNISCLSNNKRHPRIHWRMAEPDWCIEDLYFDDEFVIPEERDPFLDVRVVEFILSLPPLPWLFNKHLLRTAMQDNIPEEIVKRPKTPMGDTLVNLLKLESSSWVDSWKAIPEINQYITRDKIPELINESNYAKAVINVRPLILNQWLEGLLQKIKDIKTAA